ncbi:hypothetical protein CSOJ01_07037 [Colletotrichum sojae]|uniref:Uncharacterized protein n=1 Tax=Colletotrichum sojae TaxID=2175907 RepID=A0A8H6MU80_9PEZI|nr:hypothetical protein CSOJ01_07037 [Colletotrichum sojae]
MKGPDRMDGRGLEVKQRTLPPVPSTTPPGGGTGEYRPDLPTPQGEEDEAEEMRIRISESADLNLNLREVRTASFVPANGVRRGGSNRVRDQSFLGVRKRKANDLSHDPIPCDDVSPGYRPRSDPFVTSPTNDSFPISLNPLTVT